MELFVPRQTNIALFVQLRERGFPLEEIKRVQAAYHVACKLFNGRYRKTGRPFICHAVGTASSVAQFDTRADMVIAALLHATYDSGQFPDGRNGKTTEPHRQWLRQQVGTEVEAILARYLPFDFETGVPERLVQEGFAPEDEDLLLISLAHEFDDLADGGLVVAPKYGRSLQTRLSACMTLARKIGQDGLAEALDAYRAGYGDFAWMEALEMSGLHGFHIAPNLGAYVRLRKAASRKRNVEVH